MKALLIYPLNQDNPSLIGLQKKMKSQVESFQKCIPVDYVCFGDDRVIFNGEKLCDFNSYPKGLNFLNFYIGFYGLILDNIDLSAYQSVIIRYPMSNPYFLKFLNTLKRKFNINVIIEIPTFPYENEALNIKRKMILTVDRMYRSKLKKYVSLIITHYGQKNIFGIPCYHMGNGIDIVEKPKESVKNNPSNDIKLLGLGNLSFYHGFDRIIEGLSEYQKFNPLRKVTFDVVGMGPEYDNLINLTEKLDLKNVVKFHGVKYGEDLQNFIDDADVGISTLAWHRAGVQYDGSLKSREYAVQGLPFITCAEDKDFEEFQYRYIVGLNNNPVNIDQVLAFFDKVNEDKNYKEEMWNYAVQNLSWDVKVDKFVQNYLK